MSFRPTAESFRELASEVQTPDLPQPKLLYRRRGLSHTLSHRLNHPLSHTLSHGTYSSSAPVVPRPREGHRRRFDEADKGRILQAAAEPGASVSEVARRYAIDRRILCRWKQELTPPAFITVEVTDVVVNIERLAP